MDRRRFLTSCVAGSASLALAACTKGGAFSASGSIKIEFRMVGAAWHVQFAPDGTRYSVRPHEHRVVRHTASGGEEAIGAFGTEPGQLNSPVDVHVSADGQIYVLDRGNSRILVFDRAGTFVREIGGDGAGALGLPAGFDVAADGTIWVADTRNHRVEVFAPDGTSRVIGEAGVGPTHLNAPRALALDGHGQVFVVDAGNARIQVFAVDGRHLRSFGSYGRGSDQMIAPHAIAIHERRVFVADPVGEAVLEFDVEGTFVARHPGKTSAGAPGQPMDLGLAPNGELHIHAVPAHAGA